MPAVLPRGRPRLSSLCGSTCQGAPHSSQGPAFLEMNGLAKAVNQTAMNRTFDDGAASTANQTLRSLAAPAIQLKLLQLAPASGASGEGAPGRAFPTLSTRPTKRRRWILPMRRSAIGLQRPNSRLRKRNPGAPRLWVIHSLFSCRDRGGRREGEGGCRASAACPWRPSTESR